MCKNDKLDDLLSIGNTGDVVRGRKAKHPKGWEPGIEINNAGGRVVTEPRADQPHDWTAILEQLLPPGFDVSQYEIVDDSVESRAWDSNVGGGEIQRLYYFKARIRNKRFVSAINIDDIVEAARNAKLKKPKKANFERAYFMQVTDLQMGQADGTGTNGIVSRILELSGKAIEDLDALKAAGRPADSIFIPITGDLVEGISGWYEMQTFSVEMDRRQQVTLVRRLLMEFLIDLAGYGLPIHVAVVPGNHGENRQNGKAFTTLGDNDDVAVIEQIADAFRVAKVENVSFTFPGHNRLSLTVEVLGHVVGLTHGHVGRAGYGVEGKIAKWFERMSAIRDPLGDSDLLFTGHYHHFRAQQLMGSTWWVQGGTVSDTSEWFEQSLGLVSDPVVIAGTITRERVVESTFLHSWPRTKPKARVISAD